MSILFCELIFHPKEAFSPSRFKANKDIDSKNSSCQNSKQD